jgi:hypothetical protein
MNNSVEVRVATPVFNVRRRLARNRLAADATGRRRRRSLARWPGAVERSAVGHNRRLAGTGGAPSHRGVMDASRWSGGRRCCHLRDPHDERTSRWAPPSCNHRRRADDARTRLVVDRRPALRMEAHRSTTAAAASERATECHVFHDLGPFAPPVVVRPTPAGAHPKESPQDPRISRPDDDF